MARRPDTPCSGNCGTLLWSGRGCLPAGQRMCRPCRSAPERQQAKRDRYAAAVQRRRNASRPATGQCHGCPASVSGIRRFCDGCKAAKRAAHWLRKNAVRRGASPLGPPISVAQIGVRDGWRCHLCGGAVDPGLPYQDRMAGTRDHLVPVSAGGEDSAANLKLAHRACNSGRGARPIPVGAMP